jgi:hypothetical protein
LCTRGGKGEEAKARNSQLNIIIGVISVRASQQRTVMRKSILEIFERIKKIPVCIAFVA